MKLKIIGKWEWGTYGLMGGDLPLNGWGIYGLMVRHLWLNGWGHLSLNGLGIYGGAVMAK